MRLHIRKVPSYLVNKPRSEWSDEDWIANEKFKAVLMGDAMRRSAQASGQWAYDQVESLVPRRVVKEAILFWERSVRARWIDHFLLVVKARQNGEPEPEPEEPH